MNIFVIALYIIVPIIVIFGVMYLIRMKRDKDSGRPSSHKVSSIKEEEIK